MIDYLDKEVSRYAVAECKLRIKLKHFLRKHGRKLPEEHSKDTEFLLNVISKVLKNDVCTCKLMDRRAWKDSK